MGVEVFFALVLTSQYRHVDILIMKNLFQGRIDLFKVIFFVVLIKFLLVFVDCDISQQCKFNLLHTSFKECGGY